MTQSLAQKRAKHALAQIEKIKNKEYDKYVSYVKSLTSKYDHVRSGASAGYAECRQKDRT